MLTMLAETYGAAESLLFARGFLAYNSSIPRPEILHRLKWRQLTGLHQEWNFAHSDTVEVATTSMANGMLILVGGGVATDIATASNKGLAAWLAEAPSEEQFQHRVDAISGRFAVFRLLGSQLLVQNDAQGLRAVFHTGTNYPAVVGSHAHLVAEVVDAPANSFARPKYSDETNLRTPPGRHSTRHGVFSLIPNTELNMPSRQVRRIYPRFPRAQRTTEELFPLLEKETLENFRLLIESGQQLVVSLSAGLDSRLTLALLRHHLERVSFFTYNVVAVQNRANQFDVQHALRLANQFNLDHTLITVDNGAPPDVRRVLAVNRHRAHAPGLAHLYRERFPSSAIHMRSNGNGTLTAWYLRDGWPDESMTPEYRMQVASQGRCSDLGVLDAFTDSWQASEAHKVETLGYSGLDFAYAEDRMGSWHQNIVQESDIAFETRVPFGSRRLIDLFLSAASEDRKNGRVFVELIRRNWPDLLSVPVNGVSIKPEGSDGLWTGMARPVRKVLTREELLQKG